MRNGARRPPFLAIAEREHADASWISRVRIEIDLLASLNKCFHLRHNTLFQDRRKTNLEGSSSAVLRSRRVCEMFVLRRAFEVVVLHGMKSLLNTVPIPVVISRKLGPAIIIFVTTI